MLINMKEMLEVADKNGFAVPAFNIGSESILKGVVQSANEKNAPVFLDDAFSQYDDLRFKTVFSYLSDYAKHTQVIISACRENEIYQNSDNIHIIKL